MGWGRAEGGSLFHCKRMGGVIIIHTITIIHTKYIVGKLLRQRWYVKVTELYCVPLPASIKFQILLT